MEKYYIRYLVFAILLITISSINAWTILPIGNTTMWWIINSSIIIVLIKLKYKFFNLENQHNVKYINYFIYWAMICVFRGGLIAENYWEWKQLITTTMFLLLPLTVNIATNPQIIQKILSVWLKYALPAFFIFIPFLNGEAYGRYLIPLSFLLLFFPKINNLWRVIILVFSAFVIFGYLDARSNIIKFIVPILLSFIYYFRLTITKRGLNIVRITFLALPLLLFSLGATGIFNIFEMEKTIGEITTDTVIEGEKVELLLTADTRTIIYNEVIGSAVKNNYVIFGRTPARGYDSQSFGYYYNNLLKIGKNERYENETSILNLFTWLGLIGVILYFMIFFWSTNLAVNYSKNIYIKIVGLFVAFRWFYAWVEDFSRFDLSNFILWVMIGMCISKSFRQMNNTEFVNWIQGIFNLRYSKIGINNIEITKNVKNK